MRTLIPLLILGVVASEALAGPGVLTDQEMDAITAANSGQEQQWVVAGDRPMVDTFHTRATAQHEIRTPANVAVDTAGVRDAATAVARGSEAAVSALRAAGVRVPADLNSGTARSSQSVTAVSRSNERVVKATASASASGTDRLITRTVTRVSLKN